MERGERITSIAEISNKLNGSKKPIAIAIAGVAVGLALGYLAGSKRRNKQ